MAMGFVGVTSPWALAFGIIFVAIPIVSTLVSFFLAPRWLIWMFQALPGKDDFAKSSLRQILPSLSMFLGLGLGIYLSVLVFPPLLTALSITALPHVVAILTGLALVFNITCSISLCAFVGTMRLVDLLSWFQDDYSLGKEYGDRMTNACEGIFEATRPLGTMLLNWNNQPEFPVAPVLPAAPPGPPGFGAPEVGSPG